MLAVLPLVRWCESLRSRLEITVVFEEGVGAEGLIPSLRLKRRRVTGKHVEILVTGAQRGAPLLAFFAWSPPVVHVPAVVYQRPAVPFQEIPPPVAVCGRVQLVAGPLAVGTGAASVTRGMGLGRGHVL